MCNACGFLCCAHDGFSGCGCDDCDCPDCWSDDGIEFDNDDYDYDYDYDSEQANQCDGCMAGMALKEGNLHTDYSGNVVMVCQSDRYRVEQGGVA